MEEVELVKNARVALLEELIEWNLREYESALHTIKIAGEHYTYRHKANQHTAAVQDLERFHVSELGYSASIVRTRAIRDKVYADRPKETPQPPAIKSCNRHEDCNKAVREFIDKNHRVPGANFHCHDDECEDCFGN